MLLNHLKYSFAAGNKIVQTAKQAIEGVQSGNFLLYGGFGICGIPMNLINELSLTSINDLTIASNDGGAADIHGDHAWGLEFLFKNRQVKRMISSYLGYNKHYESLYLNGELELEFCPQGTLAEKIRSGGAGIPAFYTKTGIDTLVEKGGIPIKFIPGTQIPEILSEPKDVKVLNGQRYLLETTYFADFAFVKAQTADKYGNLVFNKTARNFNQDMCKAAKCVVAEVDEILEDEYVDPKLINVPGVYVDRVFKSPPDSPFSEKKIERLAYSEPQKKKLESHLESSPRMKIMRRAAKEVENGMNVNLGIGIPTLLPQVLPQGVEVNVHAENGVIGAGPYPQPGK